MSVWPGARWVPGGHSTFFGLCNTFVHFFMYFYYMMAAMGPQYQKYIWWKRHMTNLQMIQFVAIFIHGSLLLITNDCNYPTAFGYFIAAHAVLFFVLFAQFYIREYLDRGKLKQTKVILQLITQLLHQGRENFLRFEMRRSQSSHLKKMVPQG